MTRTARIRFLVPTAVIFVAAGSCTTATTETSLPETPPPRALPPRRSTARRPAPDAHPRRQRRRPLDDDDAAAGNHDDDGLWPYLHAISTVEFAGSNAVALVLVNSGASTAISGAFALIGCEAIYSTVDFNGTVRPFRIYVGAGGTHRDGASCTPDVMVKTTAWFVGGYLDRVPSEDDRRVVYAEVTGAAAELIRANQPMVESITARRFAELLDEAELDHLHDVMHRLSCESPGWAPPDSVVESHDHA